MEKERVYLRAPLSSNISLRDPTRPTDFWIARSTGGTAWSDTRIPAYPTGGASQDPRAKRIVERDAAFDRQVSDNIVRALEARRRGPMR